MRMRLLWLAGILALFALPATAQRITAAIRGTVTDPTQAVVGGAKVTVRSEDTGMTRTMMTNADGIYFFPELPVGSYVVSVQAPGFKAASATKIGLNVAETRAVDFQLVTGDLSESISVEANAVQVSTIGGEVAGLVTGEQARELPLNGRNFMQLTLLMPGVNAADGMNTRDKGLSGGADISVSGGSTTSNLWMVDGANNNDVGSNRTILVYPSLDSIAEFKIQRNNYGAEFGQAGGAQVNLVTRGGTNDWHGSAYYYARRDRLNGTDYFLKQANQEKPALHWDDFGGTLGGPLVKDKIHFFFSEELNKDKRSTTRVSHVPTAAERLGDFSGPSLAGCTPPVPNDPLTGRPFPGNKIPADRLSPAGLALVKLYSLPNNTPSAGCNTWVQAVKTPVEWRQENARLDWTVNNTSRLMIRYTQDTWKADTNQWGDDPWPVVGSLWNQPGRSLVAQVSKNIGSNAINNLTFSYSANKIEVTRGGDTPDLVAEITAALPTSFPASQKQQGGLAQPRFQGVGVYGQLWNQAPWLNNQDLFVLKDDYSAVFGKHVIKIGVLTSYNKKNEEPRNTSEESVTFDAASGFLTPTGYQNGLTTGNPLADLLLRGTAFNTSEVQTNNSVKIRWRDLEGYVADSYKVGSRVTADVGVRVSRLTMPYMDDNRYGSFDPASVNRALGNSACNGVLYPPGTSPCRDAGIAGGTEGPNRQLQPQKAILIAPRLGLAWDVNGDGKSALRGGAGLFYSRERMSPALNMGSAPPFSGTAAVTRTLDSAASVTGQSALGFGAPSSGWEQKAGNPYNWQWNLTYQRELVRNTTLELSYVGSKGGSLLGTTNLNEIPAGDANGNGVADRLEYARTGDAALRPLNGVAGIADGNVGLWQHNRSSIYHSLQTQLVSRFGRGSHAQLSYTFAKALSDSALASSDSGNGVGTVLTYTDASQPGLERRRPVIDRTHVFSGSLVLALPTFADRSGFVRHVLGDWQVTSIVAASTGSPITVFIGNVPGLAANAGASGTGFVGNQRPNVVEGQDCRARGGSKEQWFNPAAWTLNGFKLGTIGNSGRGVCEGPGSFQADLALYKNIPLRGRAKLQLRAEVFNVFDTVNLTVNGLSDQYGPSNVVFDTGSGSTASTIIQATPAGTFGQLTTARDPRQVQLGVRLSF